MSLSDYHIHSIKQKNL